LTLEGKTAPRNCGPLLLLRVGKRKVGWRAKKTTEERDSNSPSRSGVTAETNEKCPHYESLEGREEKGEVGERNATRKRKTFMQATVGNWEGVWPEKRGFLTGKRKRKTEEEGMRPNCPEL